MIIRVLAPVGVRNSFPVRTNDKIRESEPTIMESYNSEPNGSRDKRGMVDVPRYRVSGARAGEP